MTILEAIQAIVDTLTTPVTFIYGDEYEANVLADKMAGSELPILVIFPIVVTDKPGASGVLKSTFPLYAMFLNKDPDEAAIQKDSAKLESKVVAPMRALAREFVFKLNQSQIIDPEEEAFEITHEPIYNNMDANLHGIFSTGTVPVIEGITGCAH